jgi:GNAT superfamily N-acetyltransferase
VAWARTCDTARRVPTRQRRPLATAVAGHARPGDRVLDLGTGSGINALAAARAGATVIATDHNPHATNTAQANATRNHLADRIEVRTGDLYDVIEEAFDLIAFDPPFRWFHPRDLTETAITDHDYQTLRRFITDTPRHLRPGGTALAHFGTTADLAYLHDLLDAHRYTTTTIATAEHHQDGHHVTYVVLRVAPPEDRLVIETDDPRAADVSRLLATHLAWSNAVTAAGHVHALDTVALTAPDISFYSARRNGRLVGVGALRHLDHHHAEIKSMHTAHAERGTGIGRAMVEHLLHVARVRHYHRVSLETGTMNAFTPARALYHALGFVPCAPFGDYTSNPHSTCMTLELI